MAATSQDGRACAVRDANLSALRQAFDRRDGLVHRVHLNHCQDAAYAAAHPGRTVAGAWVGQALVRWGAGRCRARCQELVRDCRWASGAGEELGHVQAHRTQQPQGVRRRDACRGAQSDLLVELHQVPDALPRVAPQEQLASWDAQERALEQEKAVLERPQGKLTRVWAVRAPPDAQRAQREQARHRVQLELFLAQQEPPRDGGLRADALQADGPQAHGQPEHVSREHGLPVQPLRVRQVSRELPRVDAGRVALAQPWPLLPSLRVPHRRLLRRPRHPSDGGGLFRQLRRRSNWSGSSFRLRQIPEEGQ